MKKSKENDIISVKTITKMREFAEENAIKPYVAPDGKKYYLLSIHDGTFIDARGLVVDD